MESLTTNLTTKDIVDACDGVLISGTLDIICENFVKDSREVREKDTYIGIKGENFDGNQFYIDALEKGATCCILQDVVVNENIKEKYSNRAIIIVKDTRKALLQIAKLKRSFYNIPVVGVTGSVGKTSTKDIIASVLSQKYNVLKTEGNMNNAIGLPMTILKLRDHNALVVEMGMNALGEISELSDVANPTIAIINNVGTAHIGELGSRENILKAKIEITEGLSHDGMLIINGDNDMLAKWNEKSEMKNVLTFGINEKNIAIGKIIEERENGTLATIKIENQEIEVNIPIAGEHFVYNSACAALVGILCDVSLQEIKQGIENFKLSKNRLEIIKTKAGITIINDSYNASFDSMKASIELLSKKEGKRKIAVLGDMFELGKYSENLHRKVGTEVYKNEINKLYIVGNDAKYIAMQAKQEGMNNENINIFENCEKCIKSLKENLKNGDVVLIKASNSMKFYQIVESLK